MVEFKKTNSKELQKTISIVISLILVLMPVGYLLQFFDIIFISDRVGLSSIILVIGALILLMFIGFWFEQKENRYITWFDIIILLSLISLILSTFFAQDLGLAIGGFDSNEEGVFVLGAYLIIAYAVSLISEEKYKKILYVAITVVAFIQVIFGICQTVIEIPALKEYCEDMYMGKAYGTAKNANPYGAMMALFTGIEIGLALKAKDKARKITHIVIACIYIYMVILSGTRAAILGLIISVAVMVPMYVKRRRAEGGMAINRKKVMIVIASLAVVLTSFLAAEGKVVKDIVARTVEDIQHGRVGEDRLYIWKRSAEEALDKNWVTGLGVSNLYFSWASYSETDTDITFHGFTTVFDAHNKYINTFANQGIVGLVIYLALLIYVFRTGWKRFVKKSYDDALSILPLLLAFISFAVADFFCIGMNAVAPFYYLVIGMLASRADLNKI